MIKKTIITAMGLTALTTALTGCTMRMSEPMIVRKVGDNTLWVKDIKDNTETIKAYKVKDNYYISSDSNPGQVFNAEYALSEGITEYTYSW